MARLLYLAKRARGQILTAVSHLSSRVAQPTRDDDRKLTRVLSYLNKTKSEVMHLKRGGKVEPEVYIDASYGIHYDGSSRTGMCVMMGGVAVANWSTKQKLVTKSSTEAEVVALSDGLTSALWVRELLMAQGHSVSPLKIFQDNMGVISIMKSGRSPKHKTRHLNIRHFFARDRMLRGHIVIEYKNTCAMLADLLTKPMTGAQFAKLSDITMGRSPQENDTDPAGVKVLTARQQRSRRGVEKKTRTREKKKMLTHNSLLGGILRVMTAKISGVCWNNVDSRLL